MDEQAIESRLSFLRAAERLKDTLRSAYTTSGRTESTAEHTWRLSLLAITFADQLSDLDLLRVLKMCVLHDLGEAINGDVPAPQQDGAVSKSADERADFVTLIAPLPDEMQADFLELWDDYENGTSREAQVVKALDKIETILQHNQGQNPAEFDYAYNLHYGKRYTDAIPLANQIREILDRETAAHVERLNEAGEGA